MNKLMWIFILNLQIFTASFFIEKIKKAKIAFISEKYINFTLKTIRKF